MSPRRTFQSSGNSSRLVERSQHPNGVSRWASGSSCPAVSRWLVMVRNLSILRRCPCNPGRAWRKITGEPSRPRTNRSNHTQGRCQRDAAGSARRPHPDTLADSAIEASCHVRPPCVRVVQRRVPLPGPASRVLSIISRRSDRSLPRRLSGGSLARPVPARLFHAAAAARDHSGICGSPPPALPDCGGTSVPVTPSCTASTQPTTRVATTGSSMAAASIGTVGKPSVPWEETTYTVIA